jgi:3-methyladenine DNA glycosylase Tag
MELSQTFEYIDLIRRKVDAARKEPEFSERLNERAHRTTAWLQSDRDVLRVFARLVAYSQNAKAVLVSAMLSKGAFEAAFHNFEVEQVRMMKPATVEAMYWDSISAIRFKRKIRAIISSAESLSSIEAKYGSFIKLLERTDIPAVLRSAADVERFWQGFDNLLLVLKKEKMPFFKCTTSLLHFLLSVGYDCIKPDIIVMRVAKKGAMVPLETGDENRRKVVKDIQFYSVDRQIRPSVVDLYFLIYGGQTGVKHLVHPWFYT